jgi:hypothetical protein
MTGSMARSERERMSACVRALLSAKRMTVRYDPDFPPASASFAVLAPSGSTGVFASSLTDPNEPPGFLFHWSFQSEQHSPMSLPL